MIITKKKFFPFKLSIDRLDNSKTNNLKNCVMVCLAGNMRRNSLTKKEYLSQINKIKQLGNC